MATRIVRASELGEAARCWQRCFAETNAFGWPFRHPLVTGRLLFPTDGCQLTIEQFRCVARLANSFGDTFAYLAVLEGMSIQGEEVSGEFHRLSFDDFHAYTDLCLTLENAIYSPSGRWALVISHEFHGVLAVTEDRAKDPYIMGPEARREWLDFARQWRGDEHERWLEDIRRHVALPLG